MLVLSLEASTKVTGVALYGDDGLVAECTTCGRLTHSEQLLSSIDRVLRAAGATLDAVHAVGVATGPGSFTGIRVAVCTAKGIAFTGGIPVVPISSLEGLAYRFAWAQIPVCTLFDARKGELYSAIFRFEGGKMRLLSPEQAVPPEDLCRVIREPCLLVGEGALRYRSVLEEGLSGKALFVPDVMNIPSAASVGELAWRKIKAGEALQGASWIVPNYIRRSEAEMKREKQV